MCTIALWMYHRANINIASFMNKCRRDSYVYHTIDVILNISVAFITIEFFSYDFISDPAI
jgi:hypothetical protein